MPKEKKSNFYSDRYKYGIGGNFFLRNKNTIFIFLFFWAVFSFISFWKNDWLRIQFIPGCVSKTKVTASIPFEYYSKIRTKRLREQEKYQQGVTFVIDKSKCNHCINMLMFLDKQLNSLPREYLLENGLEAYASELANKISEIYNCKIEWYDVAELMRIASDKDRTYAIHKCICAIDEINDNGIISDDIQLDRELRNTVNTRTLFRFSDGKHRDVFKFNEAIRQLMSDVDAMNLGDAISSALFNIAKLGIGANLSFDKSVKNESAESSSVSREVKIKVKQDSVILDRNDIIDEESYERLFAYSDALSKTNDAGWYGFNRSFFTKSFIGFVFLLCIALLTKFFAKDWSYNGKLLLQIGLLISFQLILMRSFVQLCELKTIYDNFDLISSIHMLFPFLCASGISVLIHNISVAVISGTIITFFSSIMESKGAEFFIVQTCMNFIFLTFLGDVKFRIKIVRAGVLSGVLSSLIVLAKCLCASTSWKITAYQTVFSFFACVTSAIIVTAIFPFFEWMFSACSNITLLELSDYNSPVLKQLQGAAPGTYNHSIAVSNIAEQVASSTGANPVVCKVGSLYHDIGKIGKSGYFIENKNVQTNLHDQQTPYISALIVRNHVRDGVKIAKKNKLPSQIIEAIQQHHGTTFVRYFYEKAKQELLSSTNSASMTNSSVDDFLEMKLDAAAFRYDGPRPRSKENLIIMMADSIEAASRSLKRITRQTVEDLVNEIFNSKLADHQLDECPVTINEISKMREEFINVVSSMMHSRISYRDEIVTESLTTS